MGGHFCNICAREVNIIGSATSLESLDTDCDTISSGHGMLFPCESGIELF